MKRPPRVHVVRDAERALALMAAVVFAFALMLGSVASTPAAGMPESQVVAADDCKSDEPGLAIRAEAPVFDAKCGAGIHAASRAQSTTRAPDTAGASPMNRPRQAIPPARTDFH